MTAQQADCLCDVAMTLFLKYSHGNILKLTSLPHPLAFSPHSLTATPSLPPSLSYLIDPLSPSPSLPPSPTYLIDPLSPSLPHRHSLPPSLTLLPTDPLSLSLSPSLPHRHSPSFPPSLPHPLTH